MHAVAEIMAVICLIRGVVIAVNATADVKPRKPAGRIRKADFDLQITLGMYVKSVIFENLSDCLDISM